MNSGVRFYPSASGIYRTSSESNAERKNPKTRQHQIQRRLNPSAIFKLAKVTEATNLAPEYVITLFALRLAIIEKVASGLGTLSFIWASTIILGGFASSINTMDFVIIAIILTTEGTRIFSRSRELEWQHLAAISSRSDSLLQLVRFARNSGSSFIYTSSPREESQLPPSRRLSRADSRTNVHDSTETEKVESVSTSNADGLNPPMSAYCCNPRRHNSLRRPVNQQGESSNQATLESVPQSDSVGDLADGSATNMLFTEGFPKGLPSDFSSLMEEAADKRKAPDKESHYIDISTVASEPIAVKDTQKHPGSLKLNVKSVTTMCMDEYKACRLKLSARVKRTWSSDVVPVLPVGMGKFLSNRGVGAIFCWVQLSSAIICLVLSCWRISQQSFDPPKARREDRPENLYMSVNLFYVLALLEASMFLVERGYWEYKMNYQRLFVEANKNAGLGLIGEEIMRQFYCEVYKTCIEGSVFDGLGMDLVDFSLGLLQSDNTFEQFGGLRVLRKIVDRYDGFSADALRRIGTTPGVIERLVEMLSWRGPHHGDVLEEAAALVCRAVRYSKNCVRIAAVPGSMEMIVSLVKSSERDRVATSVIDQSLMEQLPATGHNVVGLRLDGLRILMALARDPANLLKIGEARGLVAALVSLITIKDVELFKSMREEHELKTFKKVLRLLAMLVAARSASGKILRPMVARVVSCVASMRDILEYGDGHPQLQCMAIEVLTNLALDDDIRQSIGGTGGVVRNLLMLYIKDFRGSSEAFFDTDVMKKVKQMVLKKAGEALVFLAIQNRKNCSRMMELQWNGRRVFIPTLINLLNNQKEQTVCAAKILRNLMEFANDAQKREISTCTPRLMKLLVGTSNPEMLEAVIGLAPRVVDYLDDADYNEMIEMVDRVPLIRKLLKNLDNNGNPFTRSSRVRRYSIECILALIRRDPILLDEINREGRLEDKLENTLDSISEAENFLTFSGAEGLTRHAICMEDLVHHTLQDLRFLMERRRQSQLLQFTVEHDP